MNKWVIDGKAVDTIDLASDGIPHGVSIHEKSAREFVRHWYSGNGTFDIYTSGSTGNPKKIEIHKSTMEQSAHMTGSALGLNNKMTALLAMDTQYIAGKMMMARSLTLDLNLVIVPPSSNPFKSIDNTQNIDFAALVPYQVRRLIDEGQREKLNRLKILLIGGGPISMELLRQIKSLKVPSYHSYGMTETLSHIALKRLNGSEQSESFETLEGISIKVDNRDCLTISGGFLAKPVQTNDVVELIDKRHFRWLGRYDNVINSGGVKIYPEIEESKLVEVLDSLGLNNVRFFLGGISDENLGEKVALFVEGRIRPNPEMLLKQLKNKFDKFHSPKEVIWIEIFKETVTGKLKRQEMIEEFIKS